MAIGYWQTVATLAAAGTANTAGTRASMTQGAGATQARWTMPGNYLKTLGDQMRLTASGIISLAITTPGSITFDIAMATTAKVTSNAIPMNIVAQTNQNWFLDILMTLTTTGTAAVLTYTGIFISPANILTPLPATGPGPGGQIIPYSGTATGAANTSTSFDATVSNLVDLYFTNTVGTGSCQLLQYNLSLLTATGF